MESVRCPNCREELSRIELLQGRCVSCNAEFTPAASTSHGEPEESPYKPSDSIREPLTRRQVIASTLFVAFLVTLLTPAGLVYSCYVAWYKGDSICAYPGCAHDAVQVAYVGGVQRGYCDDHARQHAASVPATAVFLPYVLGVLALFYCTFLVIAFVGACGSTIPAQTTSERRRDPFRSFVILSLIGIVGMNCLFWALSRYAC